MQIEQSKLDNGMMVITARLPGFDSAAVAAVVRAGARYETEANNGVAHFLEHMAFKGTRTRSAAQISGEAELCGSSIGASTSQAATFYYVSGLRATIANSLAILGDILINSVFAEADIDIERGVILQEIKQTEDLPHKMAGRGFAMTAYPNQPLGRSIAGRPEFVRSARASDFMDYLEAHYHAANMAVIGAGDIDHMEFRGMVADHFAAMPVRGSRIEPEPARWVGGFHGDASRPFEQVHIFLALPSVPLEHPAYYAHVSTRIALGAGLSCPLFRELREKRGLVYAIAAGSEHQHDHGYMWIYGATTADKVDEFLKVTCDLLSRADEVITERDITRAKNSVLVGLTSVKEAPFGLAGFLAAHFSAGSLLDPAVAWRKIEAVALEDVRMAARSLLKHPPTLSMVGPIDPARDYYASVCSGLKAA